MTTRNLSALLSASCFSAFTAFAADNLAPSRTNPGNFPVERVPQFVCIGSDDNYSADGFKFFLDALQAKVNKSEADPQAATFDGAPARMAFYINSNNGGSYDITSSGMKTLAGHIKQGFADGFEIGDHTKTHATSSKTTLSGWTSEIEAVLAALTQIGVNRTVVTGFRTPFLAYNDNTFAALQADKQFRYDCSIQSGMDAETDGTNFVWPYTLDNGPFAPDVASEPEGVKVGHHPGLWETPVYCVIVPPELRHQVWLQRIQKVNGNTYTAVFDTVNGKVTGMDYNILSWPGNYGGLGFDSLEYVSTLKHSLDLRLKGNRAPFCFTVHSNIFYDQQGWNDEGNTSYNGAGAKSPRATVAQARGAIADFLNYALSKPEVRVITQDNLVNWCAHPAALASPAAARPSDPFAGRPISARIASGRITVDGLPGIGAISVTIFDLSGRQLAQAFGRGPGFSWRPEKTPSGLCLLRLQARGFKRFLPVSL